MNITAFQPTRQPLPRRKNHDEKPDRRGNEKFRDFPNREGYDDNFLGTRLELPQLTGDLARHAAPMKNDPKDIELEYTHFSVIQHKERRMPLLTAVNVDGAQYHEVERDGKWAFDARIDRRYQLGEEAYKNNPFDKGHMVRRRDPMWGNYAFEGSDDTFVFTNAALQHADLNQRRWLDLENSILESAVAQQKKINVYTGPVFDPKDPQFDNQGKMDMPTQMPRAFWKVVVWNEEGKGLKAEAYLMSQEDLIDKPQSTEEHVADPNIRPFQVPLDQVEKLTQLEFGAVEDTYKPRQRR